jgi:uncharacterized RmlC-like cupin family protein
MSRSAAQAKLPACRQVQAGESFTGKQNLQYTVGISAESVGSKSIHMQLVTIPPGGRARAQALDTRNSDLCSHRRIRSMARRSTRASHHGSTGRFFLHSC